MQASVQPQQGYNGGFQSFKSLQRERPVADSYGNEGFVRHGKSKPHSLLQQNLRPKNKFQSLKQQIQELQSSTPRQRHSTGQVRHTQVRAKVLIIPLI